MYSLWDVVRRDMGDGGPSGADGLGATVGAAWAAMAPRRCRRLSVCSQLAFAADFREIGIEDADTAQTCFSITKNMHVADHSLFESVL